MMLRSQKRRSKEVSLYEPIGTDKEGNVIAGVVTNHVAISSFNDSEFFCLTNGADSESFVVEVGVNVSAGIFRGILNIKAGILELSILGEGTVTVVIGVHTGQVEGVHCVLVFLQLDDIAIGIQNLDIPFSMVCAPYSACCQLMSLKVVNSGSHCSSTVPVSPWRFLAMMHSARLGFSTSFL